jgi:predicted DNA-binding ribbon-helix-helix protein
MRLEPELWAALDAICDRERITMRDLMRRIEHTAHIRGRTSAVRVYIVDYFRDTMRVATGLPDISRAERASHGQLAMTGD